MAVTSQTGDDARLLTRACQSVFGDRLDPRIVAVILYGSVRDGNARPDSDLDIAVLDREDDRLPWKVQAVLMDELERRTRRAIDLRMLRDCAVSHQVRILTGGQPLWVADPLALEAYKRPILSAFQSNAARVHESWVATLKRLSGMVELPR